ncbi:type II toxin-antitoxin system RelE/ParE family toxin [Bradyrhizobium sp. RDI18]|uniref:type II toxin-antitoxin system RelE/ParE family toxin n=1 Tax=Bradyrhizobium sp. RDI18 TaxID=3367400 RepID=UPI00371632E0
MRVVVSLRARSDILDIHAYLSERSSIAADRLLARFSQRFDELREFPSWTGSKRIASVAARAFGYVAFYIVEVDQIVIVRVIDSRRDIETEFAK